LEEKGRTPGPEPDEPTLLVARQSSTTLKYPNSIPAVEGKVPAKKKAAKKGKKK
jgi:hypothetical protein